MAQRNTKLRVSPFNGHSNGLISWPTLHSQISRLSGVVLGHAAKLADSVRSFVRFVIWAPTFTRRLPKPSLKTRALGLASSFDTLR